MRKTILVKTICFTGAFLFFIHITVAQYAFNEPCQHALRHILSLQFKDAGNILNSEKKRDRNNLIPVYLENYIDFLTLYIGEERIQFEEFSTNKQNRIDLLEKGDKKSPFYRFCLAEVNLQWALSRLKFGDYIAAALEMQKANQLLMENQKLFPAFLLNKMGLGLICLLAATVPDNYRWIVHLMGIDGSIETGITRIRKITDYNGQDKFISMFKPEAFFYLVTTALDLYKDKQEALHEIDLFKSEQDNRLLCETPLMTYITARILMRNGLNDRALEVLQRRTSDGKACPFYFLYYMEGMCRLNRLDLSAKDHFQYYIDHFKGLNYIKAAYQKLAWIAALTGDTAKYFETIQVLRIKGAFIVDEDKQAWTEMDVWTFPSVVLLRTRLLVDGGYYEKALSELLNNSLKRIVKTRKDFIEYTYLLARIYHEKGNIPKALFYYRETIQKGKNEIYCYAAASAFQMGMIFESHGETLKAESCYRQCLSIQTLEYKTSLDLMAKAGLNRLKKTH